MSDVLAVDRTSDHAVGKPVRDVRGGTLKLLSGNDVFDHISEIRCGNSVLIRDITRFESMFFLSSLFRRSPHKDNILVVSCETVDTPFELRRISLDRFQDPTELSIEMERCRQRVGNQGIVIHHYLPHVLVKESEDLVLRMIEYWLMKQTSAGPCQFFTLPQATFPMFEKKLQSLVSGVININTLKTAKERFLTFQILGVCLPEYHMEEFPFTVEDQRLLIKWGDEFTDSLPLDEEDAIKARIDYLNENFHSTRIVRDEACASTERLGPYDRWLLLQLVGWRLEDVATYFPERLVDTLRRLGEWNLKGLVRFEQVEVHTPPSLGKRLRLKTELALSLPVRVSLGILRRRQHTIPIQVYNALRRSVQAFASEKFGEEALRKDLADFETYFQDVTARTAAIEAFNELGEDIRINIDLDYLPKLLSMAIYYGYGLKAKISKVSEGFFKIELRDCFVCEGTKSENPVCHLLVGTMVGCCSVVFKKRFSCKEIECKASGEKSCIFHLKAY
ncbi:hypothetical protein MUP59_04345 [Candidatus Bathyarchaeota archaeon]|nr:hypothetical protein [Candidatus Bathyarchaeota archaeon]